MPAPVTRRTALLTLAALPGFWQADEAPAGYRLATFSALRHIYLDEPFGESGFWDRLPALRPPALFIWGDKDVLVPAGFARFVTEALPNAQSVIMTDCGHVPQFEHQDATAALTRDFIGALPAA